MARSSMSAAAMAKRGAPAGNRNASAPGQHSSVLVRITKPDVDLLYAFFLQEGNPEPTRLDLQEAVLHAVRQVYGRKLEDEAAMIV